MLSGTNGLSTLVAQPLILTPTRLKNTLEENKKRLNIFVDLRRRKIRTSRRKIDDKKVVVIIRKKLIRRSVDS